MSTLEFRLLGKQDAERMSTYYLANEAHFKRWSPKQQANYHSLVSWQARIGDHLAEQERLAACYFIALESDQVVAHCSLSQIAFGPFQACYMGYGIDHRFEGRSIMKALCLHVIEYAYTEIGLNRIMANYMPYNNRSAKLLKTLGFTIEGRASRYLKINGRWEDHILTSLVKPL